MKGQRYIIAGFCGMSLCLPAGCTFFNEPEVCPYNTKIEYWYAGNSSQNELPLYAENLRQYLFDAEGKLLSVETLRGDSITGWNAELLPGDYTIVAWGNIDEANEQALLPENEPRLDACTLSAVEQGVPPGFRGNTSRLYYGSASFTVGEGPVGRQRIYLSHAHALLSVTVRWMEDGLRPPDGGSYRMQLRNVPAVYDFIKGWETAIPTGDGVYAVPRIGSTLTRHETRAAMSYDREVEGSFVTLRYTSNTHQLWSLRRDGELIEKELDLNKFFSTLPMDMDRNIEQEFDILVSVYKDKIVVSLASGSDWNEGGVIG